eukprot:Hpha_TRINITY_DN8932_c0_g1::TRINITY_DN8932_c0_g1_i1::g.80848::m.80848
MGTDQDDAKRSPTAGSPAGSPRRPMAEANQPSPRTGVLARMGAGGPAGWDAYHAAIAGDSFGGPPQSQPLGVDLLGEVVGLVSDFVPVKELLKARHLGVKEEKGTGKELRQREREPAGLWAVGLLGDDEPKVPASYHAPPGPEDWGFLRPANVTDGIPPPQDASRHKLWAFRCGRCSSDNASETLRGRLLCWNCGQAGDPKSQDLEAFEAGGQRKSWEAPLWLAAPTPQRCPDTNSTLSHAAWRQRFARFLAHRCPARLPGGQVEQLQRQWGGSEALLLAELKKAFGPEPSLPVGVAALRHALATFNAPPSLKVEEQELREGQNGLVLTPIEFPEEGVALGCELMLENGRDGPVVVVRGIKSGSAAAKGGLIPFAALRYCEGRRLNAMIDVRTSVSHARAQGQKHIVFAVETVPQRKRAAEQAKKERAAASKDLAGGGGGAVEKHAEKQVRCGGCLTAAKVAEGDTRFVCTRCGQACECAPGMLQPCSPDDVEGIPVAPRAECRPCPTTGDGMDFGAWRTRLMRFYAVKQPDRVAGRQLDQILRSWAGREDDLLSGMVKRYGPEPSNEEGEEALAALLAEAAPPSDSVQTSEDVKAQMEAQAQEASARPEGLRKRFMTFVKQKTEDDRPQEQDEPPAEPHPDTSASEVTNESLTSKAPPRFPVMKLKAVLRFGGLGGAKPAEPSTTSPRPTESPRPSAADPPRGGGTKADGVDDETDESEWGPDKPLSPLPEDTMAELRVDEEDGNAYPLSSFIECYGGSTRRPPEEWRRAPPFKGTAVRKTTGGDIVM